jgi:hypothetical protein
VSSAVVISNCIIAASAMQLSICRHFTVALAYCATTETSYKLYQTTATHTTYFCAPAKGCARHPTCIEWSPNVHQRQWIATAANTTAAAVTAAACCVMLHAIQGLRMHTHACVWVTAGRLPRMQALLHSCGNAQALQTGTAAYAAVV